MELKDLSIFDAADCLDDEEAVAHFLTRAIETNDPAYIAHAFDVAARSKGGAKIASKRLRYRSLAKQGAAFREAMNDLGFEVHLAPTPRAIAKRKPARRALAR